MGDRAYGQATPDNTPGTIAHVIRWDLSTGTASDVTPDSFFSYPNAAASGLVVGASGGPTRATLWDEATFTATDLHAWGASALNSGAEGVNDRYAVGYTYDSGSSDFQAALWDIGASAYVNLNPVGSSFSYAYEVNGTSVVGFASISRPSGSAAHASVWDAVTHGRTDIHPSLLGIDYSRARSISTSFIGGYGGTSQADHALLWDRATSTARDLNPVGAVQSRINSVSDSFAGGWSTFASGQQHATLWDVYSGVSFDIHSLLGADYAAGTSSIRQITADGLVLGFVTNGSAGRTFVLRPQVATAVPEAGTVPLLGLAGLAAVTAGRLPLRRGRRRTKMGTCTPP
jgi:hypothetical protein